MQQNNLGYHLRTFLEDGKRRYLEGSVRLSDARSTLDEEELNVLALVLGDEKYVFIYPDDKIPEALRTLGRIASDPELSFSWYDAAVISGRMRTESSRRKINKRFEC